MDCLTTSQQPTLDHWSIVPAIDNNTVAFFLQNEKTGSCIPKNPDRPYQPFDCFRYSGQNRLVADSISGLVNCSSAFAARLRIDRENRIYNADCGDNDVILMTYNDSNITSKAPILAWGETSIVALPDQADQYNVESEWVMERKA